MSLIISNILTEVKYVNGADIGVRVIYLPEEDRGWVMPAQVEVFHHVHIEETNANLFWKMLHSGREGHPTELEDMFVVDGIYPN